jgi:hypothetical protein
MIFANFYPSLPPYDSVWQLAVHPIIKYVTFGGGGGGGSPPLGLFE